MLFHKASINRFLVERCSEEFILEFLEKFPSYISSLHAAKDFFNQDEPLITKLHAMNMLSEDERLRIAGELSDIVVNKPRATFHFQSIRSILSDAEFTEILDRVRDEVLPYIDDEISYLLQDYQFDEDPDLYFDEFKTELAEWPALFDYEYDIVRDIEVALEFLENEIYPLRSEFEADGEGMSIENDQIKSKKAQKLRSIFDDENIDCI